MTGISDEMLMAYVDGELESRDRSAVEAYLAATPSAQDRLRVFQLTGRGLSELVNQPMREPVPQRLLDAVNISSKPIAFKSGPHKKRGAFNISAWPAAMAASVTFLAAAGAAYWFASRPSPNVNDGIGIELARSGDRIATHAIAAVLDKVQSGIAAPASIEGQDLTVTPVFTFATASKMFCRQYVVTAHDASAYGSVACKAANGNWHVEAHEAIDTPRPATQKIAPASGRAGPKSIEDAVDRLIDGDVLGTDAERAIIARAWRVENERQ